MQSCNRVFWPCFLTFAYCYRAFWYQWHERAHHSDFTMCAMASQITGVLVVCLIVCSSAHEKNTWNLHVTGLCEGNPLVTGRFTSQKASNAENVFIWWRHHEQASVYVPATLSSPFVLFNSQFWITSYWNYCITLIVWFETPRNLFWL